MTWLEEAIRKLWGECKDPQWIARKLGILTEWGEPDVDRILDVVEAPGNYMTT